MSTESATTGFIPYLIYDSQEALLKDRLNVEWTLIDSDVMEGVSSGNIFLYATPCPVICYLEKLSA